MFSITGKGADIALAQWIFAALYVLTAFFVLMIYKHSRTVRSHRILSFKYISLTF
jgi:hypothetical protein